MERIGVIFALLLLALPTQAAVQMYYLHNDHLGTPRVVTDQNQAVVWKGHLKPFGETEVETEIITNHRRFPGQRLDIETRLHYNYFRDYDPRTGRYIQSDPIGLSGGLNTYAYVVGNPLMYTDPYGLNFATAEAGAFGGAFVCGPACALAGGVIGFGLGAWGTAEFWNWYNNENASDGSSCPTPDNPSWPGDDPTRAPPGTKWNGAPGSTPGDGKGNYHNPDTGESYRPDLGHPDPIGPHWDYHGPNGEKGRFSPDGTYSPK